MNVAIARAMHRAAEAAAAARERVARGEIHGGRVADGPGLSPFIRMAIAEARACPLPVASLRNLAAEEERRLAIEALPGDLREPQPRKPQGKRRRNRKRKALPREGRRLDARQATAGPMTRVVRPEGDIAIEQLFLASVYEVKVQAWFQTADAAVSALRRRAAGEEVEGPRVPTVVVEQHEMAEWARGIVWDCRDPRRCVPVERSTRHVRALAGHGSSTGWRCERQRPRWTGPTRTSSSRQAKAASRRAPTANRPGLPPPRTCGAGACRGGGGEDRRPGGLRGGAGATSAVCPLPTSTTGCHNASKAAGDGPGRSIQGPAAGRALRKSRASRQMPATAEPTP
eukprot:5239137-Pleurochrysis_carterae.AAC.5